MDTLCLLKIAPVKSEVGADMTRPVKQRRINIVAPSNMLRGVHRTGQATQDDKGKGRNEDTSRESTLVRGLAYIVIL